MNRHRLLLTLCLALPTGLLVTAQDDTQCALTFSLQMLQEDRAVFTGLTNDEVEAFNSGSNIGHRLICGCSTPGLNPLRWLDVNGRKLPNNDRSFLVDYKSVPSRTLDGSNVRLRINRDGFSCAEAGNYTCVVGTSNRSVLVTPVGQECGPMNVAVTTSPPGPVSIGTNLTLQCSADDPTNSSLTYEWFMNGIQIRGEFSPTLILGVMGPKDGGTYTCRVSNRAGLGEANVTVEVIEASTTMIMPTNTCTQEVTCVPVVVSSTPVVVSSVPMEVTNTSVEVTSTPVVVTSTPVVVSSVPMEVTSTPVEVTSTPVVVSSVPVVVASTTAEPSIPPPEPTISPGSVRLVNGSGSHEGRVEIFYNGTWGTVCENHWSRDDGLVVCLQLGYPGVNTTYQDARFGEGTGPILLDNLVCTGSESNLLQCPSGTVNCEHSQDAGVTCVTISVVSPSVISSSSAAPQLFPSETLVASSSVTFSTPVVVLSTSFIDSTPPVFTSITPDVNFSTPVVNFTSPFEATTIPVAYSSTPSVTLSSQIVESSMPVLVPSTPVVNSSTPDFPPSTPTTESVTPVLDSSTPVMTSSTPFVSSSSPDVSPSIPITESTPLFDPSTPADISRSPIVEFSTPVAIASTPDVSSSALTTTSMSPVVTISTPSPSPTVLTSSTPVMTPPIFVPASSSVQPSGSPTPSPSVDPQLPTDVNVLPPTVTDGAVPITLMWSKPTLDNGLTGYNVQYSWETMWDPSQFVKRQSELKTMSVNVSNTSYTVQDAEGFAEYCFEVSALYEGGAESPAAPEECTSTPETKPSPPLNLRQVDGYVTSSSVRLHWDAPDPPNANITHFKVYYQSGRAARQYQVSDWYGQEYVVLDGLDPSTEYNITVTAATATLESDPSNELGVTTLSTVTPPDTDPRLPADVSVIPPNVTDGAVPITLMWSKPTLDVGPTGYNVQYSWETMWDPNQFVKRQSEPKTMSVNVSNTSYTVQDAEGFAEYCFEVSALYEGGAESPAAPKKCTSTPETKPSPPQNLRQVDGYVTSYSVRLHWDAPDPPNANITHFEVYYQSGGAAHQYQVSDWYNKEYVVLNGLDHDTEYNITVTAATATRESDRSNGLRVRTLLAGWAIALIVIFLLLLLVCIIVAVVLCCVLCIKARRKREYDVPGIEKTNKVNYVYEMELQEGLQEKEEVEEHSPPTTKEEEGVVKV